MEHFHPTEPQNNTHLFLLLSSRAFKMSNLIKVDGRQTQYNSLPSKTLPFVCNLYSNSIPKRNIKIILDYSNWIFSSCSFIHTHWIEEEEEEGP